jgi:hypothetical protein
MAGTHNQDVRAEQDEVGTSGTFPTGGGASRDPMRRLARRLRARLVRPSEDAVARGSLGAIRMPDDVLLLPDGSAIAAYDGEPLLRYRTLFQLCEQHGLRELDLEEA